MNRSELTAFEHELAGGRRLVANAGADLAAPATSLLEKLAAIDAAGPPLIDGRTIRFGWSRLTLRQRGPAPVLHVHEPDFLHDPDHETVAHVDRTLRVLRDQTALLQLTGAAPVETFYYQIIACEIGALQEEECYFERRDAVAEQDSGWLAGAAGASKARQKLSAHNLATIPVYRLLIEFPAAMKLLSLPVAYMGIFQGERLTGLFRPGGIPVPLPRIEARR